MRLSIVFDGSTSTSATLELVDAAEAAGLDGVWNAEHLGLHDAVVPSALQAQRTARLDVGLVGLNPDSRNPGLLAMEVASLCAATPGRIALRIGAGSAELARQIGVRRVGGTLATVELFVTVLRRLFDGERVTASCDAFALDGFMLRPSVQPAPPVELMAMGPKMLDLAARTADGACLSAGATDVYLSATVSTIEEGLKAAGRPRDGFAVTAVVFAGYDPDDLGAARRRAARLLAYSPVATLGRIAPDVEVPAQDVIAAALREGGGSGAAACFPDATVDATALVATRATLGERLERYARTGIDEVGVVLTGSTDRQLALIAALAESRHASVH